MIFVTSGTGHYGFSRLIEEMDKIAADIDDTVIMQVGHTKYVPHNCTYFDFCPPEQIEQKMKEATVIVCHCGVGTIMQAIRLDKPFILVPRMKKYDENVDDHQLEIAKELSKKGIPVVYEIIDLKSCLLKVGKEGSHLNLDRDDSLVTRLRDYLRMLETQIHHEV
jgi:UDP-N-acetylglucosamine transferase subunit ALG13